jgi:predicted MFS family arabinose efflux permease
MKLLELSDARRGRMLKTLSVAIFLVFFQGYMVAPLLPHLAKVFNVPIQKIGLIIPAYFLAYGAVTLFYGPLSDRIGRLPVIGACLSAFAVLTGMTALAHSPSQMIWLRLFAGLSAGGITPISVGLVGDLFPYRERGQALGLIFGAVAGGMACGSTVGALLNPWIGWKGLFLLVSIITVFVLISAASFRNVVLTTAASASPSAGNLGRSIFELLSSSRARRTYTCVILFGLFQSGVYTWLGLLFSQRYGLGDIGIGCALLGYGIPGWLFGPAIGRASDSWGRNWTVPMGIAISGLATLALSFNVPVLLAALIVTIISFGCDMTQPALAAIVTDLTPKRGLAVGVFAFSLFTGFGLGSLVFGSLLGSGLSTAFFEFGFVAVVGAFCSGFLFKNERFSDAIEGA